MSKQALLSIGLLTYSKDVLVLRDPTSEGYESEISFTDGNICPLAFPEVEISVTKLIGIG